MFFGTQKKTVDQVLLAFSEAVTDLERVEQEQLAEADAHQQTITYAEAAKATAMEESIRAKAVRAKLLKLIS